MHITLQKRPEKENKEEGMAELLGKVDHSS